MSALLPLGTFVFVGGDAGVVVGWPNGKSIPEEHYAIWYGETNDVGHPKCRTVPMKYCLPANEIEYYH